MKPSELLAALAADPEDLALRARLAAWYAAHGERERGEFVRLQAEEMRFGARTPVELRLRAAALLGEHEGRWRTVGCPECRGSAKSKGGGTCLTCDGFGDAGGIVSWRGGTPFFTLPVAWRGGTPHAVTCKLFEALYGDGSPGRWVQRVAANFGTVRAFHFRDRDPNFEGGRWWWKNGDRDGCEGDACRLPSALLAATARAGNQSFVKKNKAGTLVRAVAFSTRAGAASTLATAAWEVVRAAVLAAAGQKRAA